MFNILASKSENLETKYGTFKLTLELHEYDYHNKVLNTWVLLLSTLDDIKLNGYYIEEMKSSDYLLKYIKKDILDFINKRGWQVQPQVV